LQPIKIYKLLPKQIPNYLLFQGDVEKFLDKLPEKQYFDLVVTSPPYNIGKKYEQYECLSLLF
jgi:adenine-specific DNA-methyltransferase